MDRLSPEPNLLEATRGSLTIPKFQGHTLGKILVEIVRPAGMAFVALSCTNYLAGTMILPPLCKLEEQKH